MDELLTGAEDPEIFGTGEAQGRFRHAVVVMRPGPPDEAVEVWFGTGGSAARSLVQGRVVHEARVEGDTYVSSDFERRSVVVREGFPDLDRRAPLRPVLDVAYAVTEDRDGLYRRIRSAPPRRTGGRRAQHMYVAHDLSSQRVSELEIDGTGLPLRAVVDGEEVEWNWRLDEIVGSLPARLPQPEDAYVERYESRPESQRAAIPHGYIVEADYDFDGPTTPGTTRYVVLATSPTQALSLQVDEAKVVVSIGRRGSPRVDAVNDPDAFHLGSRDASIHVLGSRNGAVNDLLPAIDAVLRSDALALDVVREFSWGIGRLGEYSGTDDLRQILAELISSQRLEREPADETSFDGTAEPTA